MAQKPFNAQPTLEDELVRLRPLRADEFEALYAVASDPLIWELHPQPMRYQREVFQTFFDGAIKSRGALVIEEKATGRIIGCSRYYDAQPAEGRITIGYTFLARSYWGGTFNREVKALMLAHAFQSFDRVLFEIGVNNLRSRRAIEKLGARLVGELPLDGKPHVVYCIERS